MKFELIAKHKATLKDVDIQSLKMGQTETVPAVLLTFKLTMANSALDKLDKTLLPFLYEKGNSSTHTQATLEGIDVISDMPSLTFAASKLGAIAWGDEQTGCKLYIYQGVTGDGDIKLKDGTATVKKIDPKEGGAVDFYLSFYTADLDADTLGQLAVLKSHELDIEMTAPEIVSAQASIPLGKADANDDDSDGPGDNNPFPVGADDAPRTGAQSPFLTPEQALANSVGEAPATVVTTRRPSRLKAVGARDAA